MARAWLIVLWSGLLFVGQARAAPPARPSTIATINLRHSRSLIQVLDHNWRTGRSEPVSWTGINTWQRFVIVDALADYAQRSKDRSVVAELEHAVTNRDGLDGNDDDLWAVIAALNAHDLRRNDALLVYGEQTFDRITSQYWDDVCGGGLWWDHERTYKNAITNSLLAYAASQLYLTTGQAKYADWARRAWVWLSGSGMINATGLLNDGLDKTCHNNGDPTYTYNQGVALGALTNLYLMSGDTAYRDQAIQIALASLSQLSSDTGALREPVAVLGPDGVIFKGIFMYHLGRLVRLMPEGPQRRTISAYILRNADLVWRRERGPGGAVNAYWDGPSSAYGAASQAAAIDLFDAAADAATPARRDPRGR